MLQKREWAVLSPHGVLQAFDPASVQGYRCICVALDFSDADIKAIQHALHVGGKHSRYLLVHAVETAGAVVMGDDIRDFETHSDSQRLQQFAEELNGYGYQCDFRIGYGSAKKAIPELVNGQENVDLLVLGSHGHKGLKDLIFGTTVGAVRHAVKVPVLIAR